MTDSFSETKRELFELMRRLRSGHFMPPSPDGMTQAEARTMMALADMARCHDETRPNRVAEYVHTTPSALSQTFKSLEEKGLIERHRAGGDYRGVTVSLTEDGSRRAAEGKRLHGEHMDQVMAYVGDEDMRHLVRIMNKIMEFHEQLAAQDSNSDVDRTGGGECPALHRDSSVEGGDAPCA